MNFFKKNQVSRFSFFLWITEIRFRSFSFFVCFKTNL